MPKARKTSSLKKTTRGSPTKNSKKSLSKKTLHKEVIELENWPLQRNVFFRPQRFNYVRRIDRPIGCVFCRSASHIVSVETLCVYKTEHSQIVMNKYPYNTGHMLVLPLRHAGDLLTLSDVEYDDLHRTLRTAVKAVETVYSPHAFNIGLNHGVQAGAGLPDHLHYHLVPRWGGDLNFFSLIAETKLVIETVEQSYEKMENYFQQLKVSR